MKNKDILLIICATASFTVFSMEEEREDDPVLLTTQMNYQPITAKKKSCWPSSS